METNDSCFRTRSTFCKNSLTTTTFPYGTRCDSWSRRSFSAVAPHIINRWLGRSTNNRIRSYNGRPGVFQSTIADKTSIFSRSRSD